MFDPYAAALTAVQLPEGTNVVPPKAGACGGGEPSGNPPATMGCLSALADAFDWGESRRWGPFPSDARHAPQIMLKSCGRPPCSAGSMQCFMHGQCPHRLNRRRKPVDCGCAESGRTGR